MTENFSARYGCLLALVLTGCPQGPLTPPDAGGDDDGGTCTDTWEQYGQGFFTSNCTGCHTHDHANFATQAAVYSELSLISANIGSGLMPQGATLDPLEKQRVLAFLSCGAKSATSPVGVAFEAESARAAVAKVKGLLVGLPPTDAEVQAVASDPSALKGLVDGWMVLPEYEAKMRVFFELAFQQTQITQADFVDLIPPQGLGPGAAVPLLVQNARESFARTVLALNAEGKSLTDAFTTHRLMLTPALMELYAFLDTRRVDDAGRISDDLAGKFPTVKITLGNAAGPVPIEQSVDPTSPNFMRWYDPDVTNLTYPDPTCNSDPITIPVSSYAIHYLLSGAVANHLSPSGGNCAARGGTAAGVQLTASDFTSWKMVTLRKPSAGESITRFYDLPALRGASELVLKTPRAGFFSTPAFFANWPTNQSNQMRVTANQALIVATGMAVDGLDPTSTPLTPGIDPVHAQATDCNACHRILDPTRSILSSSWSWFYYPQTNAALVAEKGRFQFQGVNQPVATLDDFAQVLARHPAVAAAWAQKLCTWANSEACAPGDPEFQRVVAAFSGSNFSWATLTRELMSSPLITNLAPTATNALNGEVIGVTRRDHLCAALNARLGLNDVCGLTLVPGVRNTGALPRIVGGLPSDGYGRGATQPVLPNLPTLFYRSALENICLQAANFVIDAAPNPSQPNAKRWSSAQADVAIGELVSTIVGLPPGDPRTPAVTALLTRHYRDALTTQSRTEALKSTFTTACLSPTFIGVGM